MVDSLHVSVTCIITTIELDCLFSQPRVLTVHQRGYMVHDANHRERGMSIAGLAGSENQHVLPTPEPKVPGS